MEKKKPGRPKSDKPTRCQNVTLRLSIEEYENLRSVCYENRITYTDVILKGIEFYSNNGGC